MLAYLLLVHTSPRQVARLVNALQAPGVSFYIHVDRKAETGQFRYMLRHHPNVRFVRPRQVIEWGGWNMVEAELLMTRWALRDGAQHLTLLSGMDYPVWSNRRLTDFFLGSKKSYIEHFQIPSVFWDRGAVNRVRQYWLCDDPIRLRSDLWFRTAGRVWRFAWHRMIRRSGNLAFKLAFELGIRRRPPRGLVPYVGSQWWSITRECAEYVLDYVQQNPGIVRFYRHSHVPDEGFFQTVVMNSPLRDSIVNDNLRYIEWDGGFNPRVLDFNDLSAIMESGCAFARKIVLGTVSSDNLVRALDEQRAREEESLTATRNGHAGGGNVAIPSRPAGVASA